MSFNIYTDSDFDTEPKNLETGAYFVIKNKIIKTFLFSTSDEAYKAYSEMRKFVLSRKDRSEIRVQLV